MNKKEIEEKGNHELFEEKENTIKYWKKMKMIDIIKEPYLYLMKEKNLSN